MKCGEKRPDIVDSDAETPKPSLFYQTTRTIARSFFRFGAILFRFSVGEKVGSVGDSCDVGEIAI
ncbi:MAG: hypothetical protein IJ387_11880 [Thermoguttaceae bacterium]|nr:hypothetical protein [Thermoguttaceae bacterium]